MAQPPTGLTFVLDENLGGKIPTILKLARVLPVSGITSLEELGYERGAQDVNWMSELGKSTSYVVVTRDAAILNVAAQSAVWRNSGLRLMLLSREWGRLPAPDLVRALLYWWPLIVEYAGAGSPGSAWVVSHRIQEPPSSGIRLVPPRL